MTGAEFAELSEWILDRWGRAEQVWANAPAFAADFAHVDAADVWAGLSALMADPEKARWAPKPAELVAAARAQARARLDPTRRPALETGTERGSFADWCRAEYGEVLSMAEVIQRRATP